MIEFTGEMNSQHGRDLYHSGAIKMIGGKWYWTEYHVAYSQQGVCTADNFVTAEEAAAKFEARLADVREGWGHNGAKWSEEEQVTPTQRRIRFRSIRKNGKAGTLTGSLYMNKIDRSHQTRATA